MIDARLVAVIAEDRRRELATGVTVYAGIVNEKVACNVLWESPCRVYHERDDLWMRMMTPAPLEFKALRPIY
jgi:hypothetical protein